MPIHISWDDEAQTTLLMAFDGRWTWAELREANAQITELIGAAAQPIHLITDMTTSAPLPSGALSEARSITAKGIRHAGMIVAVDAGRMVEMMYGIFHNLYGARVNFPRTHFVATLDEARVLIAGRQTDAPDAAAGSGPA